MTDPTRPTPDPGADTTVTPVAAVTTPAVLVTSGDDGTHEPAGAIATTTVSPEATSPRPRSRIRWVAALAIVAVVVLASAAAAFVLTGSAATATVLGYVPADSVAYGELRLDLPGDQEQAVGAFLSKFPGFADQAALDSKLDEVLDQLVKDASSDKQTFTKDIKPWFDGEMAFAVGPLPTSAGSGASGSTAADGHGLVLLSIKDATLATSWFSDAIAKTGVTTTTDTYQGVELTVTNAGSMSDKTLTAFGIVDGKVALVGDLASVKAAIDTGGDGGLSKDPSFTAATDALDGAYIGFMYVDMKSIVESGLAMGSASGVTPAVGQDVLALVPDWAAFRLRVEKDALVMDSAMPHDDARPGPNENRANGVAAWAPPTTLVLMAGNDYGATLQETIDTYRKDADLKDVFAGIDQAAGVLGGLDAAIGWMGDTGIVVSQDGDALEGGIISVPTDAAAARQFFTTLRSFAALGGAQAGISVKDEDYGGTTITVIDLGSAKGLAGMAGALGGSVPTDPSALPLPDGNVQLAYAVTDGVVVLGSGPDFVKSVLDAGAGTSLADDARYGDLVGRVGDKHTGVGFVDLAAIRTMVERHLADATAAERADYEESVKPFLEPLDALAAASTVGGDVDTQQFIVTVK